MPLRTEFLLQEKEISQQFKNTEEVEFETFISLLDK